MLVCFVDPVAFLSPSFSTVPACSHIDPVCKQHENRERQRVDSGKRQGKFIKLRTVQGSLTALNPDRSGNQISLENGIYVATLTLTHDSIDQGSVSR